MAAAPLLGPVQLNSAHARYLEVRRRLLIGRLDEAELKLAYLDHATFPPALRGAQELVVAGERATPAGSSRWRRVARQSRGPGAPDRRANAAALALAASRAPPMLHAMNGARIAGLASPIAAAA
jgi:hypothetical protein